MRFTLLINFEVYNTILTISFTINEYILEILITFDILVVSFFFLGRSLFKLLPCTWNYDIISASDFQTGQNVPATYCICLAQNKTSAHFQRILAPFSENDIYNYTHMLDMLGLLIATRLLLMSIRLLRKEYAVFRKKKKINHVFMLFSVLCLRLENFEYYFGSIFISLHYAENLYIWTQIFPYMIEILILHSNITNNMIYEYSNIVLNRIVIIVIITIYKYMWTRKMPF